MSTSLLILGFIFLGKGFGVKIAYTSMAMFISLSLLERVCLLSGPLTTESLLKLLSAVFLLAAGIVILFSLDTSSGDTDIVAMILEKYISLSVGTVLMLVDVAAVASLFFILGSETGPFSTVGPTAKSLVIDDMIENLNPCKCFNIICDNPDLTCDYIINTLYRSATAYHAQGAFTYHEKTVIMTTMKRNQTLKLRSHIRTTEPMVLMLTPNSSEIIGKGFLTG